MSIKTVSAGWHNLDAWSEMYIALQWIVADELPDLQHQASSRHSGLAQLALVGAHHLVEFTLFKCIRSILDARPDAFPPYESRFPKAGFKEAFENWPADLTGMPFNIGVQPFKSVVALAQQRNATTHKESAITSIAMARSAAFTAVEGSCAVCEHLLGDNSFPYHKIVEQYPLPTAELFSEVRLLDAPGPK